jgi:1,4-dihydroxy-2-naphthoate octaprenyltransferase
MQACSIALTGKLDPELYSYSVPIGLLTECILWANNARDIESDTRAKVKTVCNALGFTASKQVYQIMVYLAYGAVAFLAWQKKHPGLALPLVTLPLAAKTCAGFKEGKDDMKDADERSAQLHLPFGALMIMGVAAERAMKSSA